MQPVGIITQLSRYPVNETVEKLIVFLQDHGARVYARINQQTELEGAGIVIRPLECLLFGNPAKGGQVMVQNRLAALDLPLKIICWEDDVGRTLVAFYDTALLEARYSISADLVKSLDLNPVVSGALGPD
jgi:uncharacterized protein (DUF302 family)